ncbi:hypothetical protein TrVFT333_009595 [Trichoderma virens FT-333]|nr:hypothetical protein TrVFT333_009595 [Trichoderma virens FT-333]
MLVSASTIYGLSLSAALYGLTVDALAIRRYDGTHRMAKLPQITQPAVLLQRKDDVCGVGMKLCPANLGGNCCPENYACATNSCYSTASSTSTSSASSYTYACPTSQYLCPASLGYGCCPDGMGCGASRCYSTQPITMTVTTAIMSTASGTVTTITTTSVTVRSPSIPTGFGTLDDRNNDDNGSQTADTSATSVPKYVPPAETGGSDSQDGGLSTTQLGGIIGGAVALLALVVAAALVLIRHIDKLANQMSRKANSSKTRSTTKQTSVSDSESRSSRTDSTNESLRRSRARRKHRSRSTVRRNRQRRNGLIATRSGNFMTERVPGRQDSADIALQVLTRNVNCCGAVVPNARHGDVVSPTPINEVSSPRLLSSPSPISDMELEASSLAQELAGTSSASSLAADLLIHYPQEIPPSDLPRVATRPPLAYQWMRSIGLLRESENASPDHFCIDDEEWHGFYGSPSHMAGRTGLGISYTDIRGGGYRQYR